SPYSALQPGSSATRSIRVLLKIAARQSLNLRPGRGRNADEGDCQHPKRALVNGAGACALPCNLGLHFLLQLSLQNALQFRCKCFAVSVQMLCSFVAGVSPCLQAMHFATPRPVEWMSVARFPTSHPRRTPGDHPLRLFETSSEPPSLQQRRP